DKESVLQIIKDNVEEGSIIYTDQWKAYDEITPILGNQHGNVNHSKHFKDPETEIHTNTIEGNWNGLKILIPARNRNEERIEPFPKSTVRKTPKPMDQIPKDLISIWKHPTKNDLQVQDEMNQIYLTRDTNLLSQILGVQLEPARTYPDLINQYIKEHRTTSNFEITLKGSPEPSNSEPNDEQTITTNLQNSGTEQTLSTSNPEGTNLSRCRICDGKQAFTITKNAQTLFVENVEDHITAVYVINSSNTVQKEYYGITTETKPVDAIKKKYRNELRPKLEPVKINNKTTLLYCETCRIEVYQQISDDNASDKEIIREQLIDSGSLITYTSCGTEKLKQQMENWGGLFFCKTEERLAHTIALELINPNYTFEGRLRHWTESTRKRTSYSEVNLTLTREIFEEIRMGRINLQTVNREIQPNDIFLTPNGIMPQQFINEEIMDETDEQLFGQLIFNETKLQRAIDSSFGEANPRDKTFHEYNRKFFEQMKETNVLCKSCLMTIVIKQEEPWEYTIVQTEETKNHQYTKEEYCNQCHSNYYHNHCYNEEFKGQQYCLHCDTENALRTNNEKERQMCKNCFQMNQPSNKGKQHVETPEPIEFLERNNFASEQDWIQGGFQHFAIGIHNLTITLEQILNNQHMQERRIQRLEQYLERQDLRNYSLMNQVTKSFEILGDEISEIAEKINEQLAEETHYYTNEAYQQEANQYRREILNRSFLIGLYKRNRSNNDNATDLEELPTEEELLQTETAQWLQVPRERKTRSPTIKPINEVQEISKNEFIKIIGEQGKSISVPPSSNNITINITHDFDISKVEEINKNCDYCIQRGKDCIKENILQKKSNNCKEDNKPCNYSIKRITAYLEEEIEQQTKSIVQLFEEYQNETFFPEETNLNKLFDQFTTLSTEDNNPWKPEISIEPITSNKKLIRPLPEPRKVFEEVLNGELQNYLLILSRENKIVKEYQLRTWIKLFILQRTNTKDLDTLITDQDFEEFQEELTLLLCAQDDIEKETLYIIDILNSNTYRDWYKIKEKYQNRIDFIPRHLRNKIIKYIDIISFTPIYYEIYNPNDRLIDHTPY
ncbi:13983_t:CDS:2, partial [Ambispora leptoticha]